MGCDRGIIFKPQEVRDVIGTWPSGESLHSSSGFFYYKEATWFRLRLLSGTVGGPTIYYFLCAKVAFEPERSDNLCLCAKP